MSIALDRNEINDVAYYGMGVVEQFVGISPAPDFVPEEIKMHMTQYDPDGANALLDEVGLKDVDGDGHLHQHLLTQLHQEVHLHHLDHIESYAF